MMMSLTLLTALLSLSASGARGSQDSSYDVLVFAQSWPVTTCIEWKERKDRNTCTIPPKVWTVHGIWPSKFGQYGPSFCDKTKKFDANKIRSILPELEDRWTNVHKNSREYGFWQHEYEKHGSCAVNIPQLDTELEYFKKGIEWNEKYPIYDYLKQAGITPGGNYTWLEIFQAVEKHTDGKNPAVQCEYDDDLKVKTLAQVYICFDKGLNLVDCNSIAGGINIGCPKKARQIYYPGPARVGAADASPSKTVRGRNDSNVNEAEEVKEEEHDSSYDGFIFAFSWPTSNCILWRERSESNTCTIPNEFNDWTIHGLWPTKWGQLGPTWCNASATFSKDAIRDIVPGPNGLEQHWTNVHKNQDEYDFWKHEWLKHGTCGTENFYGYEIDYFCAGLQIDYEFQIGHNMSASGVVPDSNRTYSFEEISRAIKKFTNNANPALQCQWDPDTKRHILSQVNLCFGKRSFQEPVDCDRIHGGLNHGCPEDGIVYPSPIKPSGGLWWIGLIVAIFLLIVGAVVGYFLWRKYKNRVIGGYQTI